MAITITKMTYRKRELTHAQSLVATNSNGVELHRPKYGCNWTIQQPINDGMSKCHYIGDEHGIRAMWDAHYTNR